jgi:glucosamine-6-phosphate deaminase
MTDNEKGRMGTEKIETRCFEAGSLKVEIHPSRRAAGEAAARAASETMWELRGQATTFGIIFATGASQLETLNALTLLPGLPWSSVNGFHMDEYEGISASHPASFRRYMREHLTGHVQMHEFCEIDGSTADSDLVCVEYAQKLRSCNPQLCLLGIGENGHLAFNDPAEADFNDPMDMKIVNLDVVCRQQQVEEKWFANIEDVPEHALTLTIPALFRVPRLVVSVPGSRKARIVRRTLEESISTECPATILRTHPDATLYLDREAASELNRVLE